MLPKYHEARIRFPNGQVVHYEVPIMLVQDYTIDHIFEKHLLSLLPYYILRYEHFLKTKGTDPTKTQKLLDEYIKINDKLAKLSEDHVNMNLYIDLMTLINDIADYIIPEDNPIKERMSDIMGGKILTLKSEELLERGRSEGKIEGKIEGKMEGKIKGKMEERQNRK